MYNSTLVVRHMSAVKNRNVYRTNMLVWHMVLGGELHLCKCGMSEGGCQQVHRLPGCCRVVGWNAAGVGVVTTAAALVAAAAAVVP